MAEETAPKSQLRRAMGFWDVLLFNIAAVLGPRWIAAAAHNGTSSISLWVLAAVFFFLPTALIIIELSTRYPAEGGLYVWSKEAFGDFHGFVAGWSYWAYTFFYFPGLLTASVAMSVYIGGPKYAWLAGNPRYLLWASLALLAIAVLFNIIGLDIGKWLQNAGGVSTYVPLMMLVGIGGYLLLHRGSATHFSWPRLWPEWPPDIDKLNFWSSIAFAFTGMELVCAMSEEVREPRKTFPRAIYASTGLIAVIYVLGTMALLWLLPAEQIDPRNGVFGGISFGSAALGIAWFGMLAALLVTVGNAGGVGATVAGVARVPFVAGIDNYLPAIFGKIHPKWKTPYISILIQAGISAAILVLSQVDATVIGAYQFLVSMSVILYFIPFLYMYAAAIKLAYRTDRADGRGVLVPGGKLGIWTSGALAFLITLGSMVLAAIPPGGENKLLFEAKLIGSTSAFVGVGLVLYFWRRMSVPLKALAFAGLGIFVGLLWLVLLPAANYAAAHSMLAKISIIVCLLSCPGFLLGLGYKLTIGLNGLLYGALAYWALQRRNRM
jgi:glutamate:GABA antiporter